MKKKMREKFFLPHCNLCHRLILAGEKYIVVSCDGIDYLVLCGLCGQDMEDNGNTIRIEIA